MIGMNANSNDSRPIQSNAHRRSYQRYRQSQGDTRVYDVQWRSYQRSRLRFLPSGSPCVLPVRNHALSGCKRERNRESEVNEGQRTVPPLISWRTAHLKGAEEDGDGTDGEVSLVELCADCMCTKNIPTFSMLAPAYFLPIY